MDDLTELEERLEKLTDDYLSEKIDSSAFSISVILTRLEQKFIPCFGTNNINGHIGLIIDSFSKNTLTSKQEQNIKTNLKKIINIMNDLKDNEDEKKQAIEDIENSLTEIFALINVK